MKAQIAPENLLVAVLHMVGTDVRLTDDIKLAYLFNKASEELPEFFGDFAWHPQYHDSHVLSSSLQNLDIGGAIVRENASISKFRATQRVKGIYGEKTFNSLPDEVKKVVVKLAEDIKKAYQKDSSISV